VPRTSISLELCPTLLSFFALGTNFFEMGGERFQFFVGEFLDIDHLVMSVPDGANNLVELEMDGAGIAILRVLNQEHHEESDDRSRSVDHELPSVGVIIALWQ
jgi:hypothetical protein